MHGQLRLWDEKLLLLVRRWESQPLTMLARLFTRMGNASGWFLMAGLLATAGPSGMRSAWLLLVAAGFATALVQMGKRLVRRARPSACLAGFTPLIELPDAFSFPSGHACTSFAVATAMLAHTPTLGLPASALAVAISFSRIYLGAHFPLDVGAGAVLGVGAGLLARVAVG